MGLLGDMMSAGAVASSLNATTKKALFQQLALMGEREYGLNPREVSERLTERERLGSTGFGKGVAIPHGKIDGLEHIVAMFARLDPPIDFEAIDDLPVDLVFCLLSPPDAGAEHLKALAQVSRWLRDPSFVAKLRGAGSDDAVYALFDGQEERHAA
jgi:PTS system nitrogen regulatory IIA component